MSNVDNLLDQWAHEESKMQITDNDYKQASLYAVLNDLQQKGDIEYYAPDDTLLIGNEALDVLVDWHIRDNPSFFSEATEDMNDTIKESGICFADMHSGPVSIVLTTFDNKVLWSLRDSAKAATMQSDAWDHLLCEMRSNHD